MNVELQRLIEGIIATLRKDVIPAVSDVYARGQAVGVIDLLNNIAPRIEWAQEPVHEAIAAKRRLLKEVAKLVPGAAPLAPDGAAPINADELLALRAALDARIGDAIKNLSEAEADNPSAVAALDLVRRHLHEEQVKEMRMTSKPLFAEIASGDSGKARP